MNPTLIKAPAIAMLINIAVSFMQYLFFTFMFVNDPDIMTAGGADQELFYIFPVWGFAGMVAFTATAFGAVQMLRVKSYAWSLAAAMLSVVPCFTLYCSIASIPIGIWALVVLSRPEVKQAFRGIDDDLTSQFD